MILSFSRMVRWTLLLSALLPLVVAICTGVMETRSAGYWVAIGLGALAVVTLGWLAPRWRASFDRVLEETGREQVLFLDGLPRKYVAIAIGGSAALSLFLELVMIRWQGSVWEFFAFYKNLGLLSCFAGLGLGYALAGRDRIPLLLTAPLLTLQALLLVMLRHGLADASRSLSVTPFREQVNMGTTAVAGGAHFVAVYSFVTVAFLLTALAFVPVGQVCGRLMERLPPLQAYRWNLLGSLAGVALVLLTSFLWTPPAIWFVVCFGGLLAFQGFDVRPLTVATIAALIGVTVLTWPVAVGWERIFSPYQLLERGPGHRGLMTIRAAGHYYQRVLDLSSASQATSPEARHQGYYYEAPYRVRETPPGRVAVVGAGSGNDVAAALRTGAQAVDAIEIDPAILQLGRDYHPERPYEDPRVRVVVDDARSFFRTTRVRYDLIVYGLLDSHTLLSHASGVRIDSFVYTVEGLREARARLTEDGLLSLSFSVLSQANGRKIYLMMQQAFDGNSPVCMLAGYDGAVIFFQAKHGGFRLPEGLLSRSGFLDVTPSFADPSVRADVSTDDWPYFYMPRRIYPLSYVIMVGLILVLSTVFFANFMPERPDLRQAAFFFLGAGFMLVETKGITEMGLVFGNTWQVVGIMISGVLVMAYLANAVVEAVGIRRPFVPYVLLLASLAVGILVARSGGFAPSLSGKLATVAVLTCPLFFSGIVFSTLIADTRALSRAMALNLLGAMFGGLLEYNSMYFGFQFLYWLAMALYLAAALSSLVRGRALAAVGSDLPNPIG